MIGFQSCLSFVAEFTSSCIRAQVDIANEGKMPPRRQGRSIDRGINKDIGRGINRGVENFYAHMNQ